MLVFLIFLLRTGIDFNMCCGTHLSNTSQLQLVKLMSTQKSRTNTRMFFLAGGRALGCVKTPLISTHGVPAF